MNRWMILALAAAAVIIGSITVALASMRPRCDNGDCVGALRAYRLRFQARPAEGYVTELVRMHVG